MLESFLQALFVALKEIVRGTPFSTAFLDGVSGNLADDLIQKMKARLAYGDPRDKIMVAKRHMESAGAIFDELRADLDAQSKALDELVIKAEEKKKEADHYTRLASISEDAFSAYREEMERVIRVSLEEQAARGRRMRRIASGILTVTTLVVGAALGAYFKDIVAWMRA